MGRLLDLAIDHINEWKQSKLSYNACSISVVIPVYKPSHLDAVISHLNQFHEIDEIILVDDSNEDDLSINSLLHYEKVIIFKHKCNLGRSAARNTGASMARGSVLLFMDQDMILAPDFISKAFNLIMANHQRGIALGLRDTVDYQQLFLDSHWKELSTIKDWRVYTPLLDSFIDLTVLGIGSASNHCHNKKDISIYKQTNGLRTLGISPNKTVGFWDLPCMVVSHSMLMPKDFFYSLGGFPEWINGWGGEDIALGFLAASANGAIMLTDSVSYHIRHNPYSGSEINKNIELQNNIRLYRNWAKEIETYPHFDFEACKNRCVRYCP